MERRLELILNDKKLHYIVGASANWRENCDDEDLWDFPCEELLDGTIEFNEDIWYYLVDGRFYESTISIEMKRYEVELFILGCPYSPGTTRREIFYAESQKEAEQMAHNKYVTDGWGVLNSKEITW